MSRPAPNSSANGSPSWSTHWCVASTVGLLLFAFLWVWLRLQPAAAYAQEGPWFYLNREFARPFLEHAGGVLDYAAVALAQCSHSDLGGALCFASLLGLWLLAVTLVSRAFPRGLAVVVVLVTGWLLLLARQRADAPALALALGGTLALGLAWVCGQLAARPVWLRVVLAGLLGGGLYAVAGPWPWGLWLATGLATRKSWGPPAKAPWSEPLAGLAGAVAVAGWWPPTQVALLLTGAGALFTAIAMAFYVAVPLAGLAARFWPVRGPVPGRKPGPSSRPSGSGSARQIRKPLRPLLPLLAGAGALLGGALLWFGFDSEAALSARLQSAAQRSDALQVIAAARQLPLLSPAGAVRLHLALAQSGRLLDELFTFTNQVAWELLPGMTAGNEANRAQAETLFRLSQINEAEHLAHEMLELEGNRPDLLWLLSQINVLKERPNAGRVFLNVLAQSPVHRARAEARLRELDADPRLGGDPVVSQTRTCLVTTDLPHDGMPTATFLEQLLHSNPRNQLASDYQIAHLLLTRDLRALAGKIGGLKDLGYQALPRHCEEAILLHQRVHGGAVDTRGLTVRALTQQRFQALCALLDRKDLSPTDLAQALARDFGDTYWSYYLRRPAPAAGDRQPTQ